MVPCESLVIRNTHATSYGIKVLANVKVFQNKVNFQVQGKKLWYHVKGLVIRNTYVKYESPTFYGI